MSGLGREIADGMKDAAEDDARQPALVEAKQGFESFMRRNTTSFRSAARLAGMSPDEYQKSIEAEAKQQRDQQGRFASTEDDDDTTEDEPVTGRGYDQGSRDERSRDTTPPSKKMSDSIRDRAASMRGY